MYDIYIDIYIAYIMVAYHRHQKWFAFKVSGVIPQSH